MTARSDKIPMFKEVSRQDFRVFLETYPRALTPDKSGISEPPLVSYSDFSAAKGFDAIVAKYHEHPDYSRRVFKISEHLL